MTVADTYKHLQKLGIQKLFTVQLSTNDYSWWTQIWMENMRERNTRENKEATKKQQLVIGL